MKCEPRAYFPRLGPGLTRICADDEVTVLPSETQAWSLTFHITSIDMLGPSRDSQHEQSH